MTGGSFYLGGHSTLRHRNHHLGKRRQTNTFSQHDFTTSWCCRCGLLQRNLLFPNDQRTTFQVNLAVVSLQEVQAQYALIMDVSNPELVWQFHGSNFQVKLTPAMNRCLLSSHCSEATVHWANSFPLLFTQDVWSDDRDVAPGVHGYLTRSIDHPRCLEQ